MRKAVTRTVFGLWMAVTIALCGSPHLSGQVASSSQDELQADLARARQAMAHAGYGDAESILHAVLSRFPDSPDAHYLLALTLLHENKPQDSLAEYTRAAKLRAPAPEDLIGVASNYIVLGDYTDADRWLTEVTQTAPSLPLGWYLLGRTQYNENRLGLAEQSFLTCLRLDPHHLKAEYNLGLVYENTQRSDSAINAYKAAIAWQQDALVKDAQPMLDLGTLLRRQGRSAEALPYLGAAAMASLRNPLIHQELGLVCDQLGRTEEAIAELEQAVALAPGTASLHFFLGRLYRKAGRSDEAARQFAEAARLSGTQSNAGAPNAVLP